jgi:hypothetical protein
MDGIIIDFIKITKDDITREAGEVNEENEEEGWAIIWTY